MGRTPYIPQELKSGPFSLDEARAAGLSLSALRGKSWQRLGARLYRWQGAGDDTMALIDAFRRALPPSAVFVGRTAAWLHGLEVRATNPVQVAVDVLESRAGLEVRHSDLLDEAQKVRGVFVTTLHRTLLDLCVWSAAVEALVVIDMAVRMRLVTAEGLRSYAHQRLGAWRLRSLAQIAAPAESPMETRLRWLLISAGLPTPDVQTDLYDHAGEFLGRADLYYPQADLVIEYDGGNHRDRLVDDDRRQNRLVRAGYRLLRFTAADLHNPDAVAAQVRGLLRSELRASRAIRS